MDCRDGLKSTEGLRRNAFAIVWRFRRVEPVMREEFLEPLPGVQNQAVLVFEQNVQVRCLIVEVTDGGFRVAAPGASHYEGSPELTLVTPNEVYPVRLILQDAHVGGYSYRLQKIDQCNGVGRGAPGPFQRVLQTSLCCSVGLIAVIAASSFCLSKTTDMVPQFSLQGLRKEAFGWWSPSIQQSDRVPPGISVDNSTVNENRSKANRHNDDLDSETVSVSLISPASMSTSSGPRSATTSRRSKSSERNANHNSAKPHRDTSGPSQRRGRTNDHSKPPRTPNSPTTPRDAELSLPSLLKLGCTGRIQAVNRTLLPWLFESATWEPNFPLRMSDAAWNDLKQFEIGLRDLPQPQSADAIASLSHALQCTHTHSERAQSVPGLRDVFVLASDDAKIYFRTSLGQTELVRVLPIDVNKDEEE